MHLPLIVNGVEQEEPLSSEAFYDLLENDGVELKTSQATPAEFEEMFSELTRDGDEVVCVLLSSTLSGTFNSARLAAMEFDGVHLVDSGQACLSETALVKRALELRDEVSSAAELAEKLEQEKGDARLLAAVPSLKYLKKGGRISPAAAAVGDLIGIKPIVTINAEGEVAVAGKSRGLKKAIRNVVDLAEGETIDWNRPVVIGFSGLDAKNARLLKEELEKNGEGKAGDEMHSLSHVLAVHAGPDAAGIGYFVKKK